MGYCWQGRLLVCDLCGTAGARKVRCPFGWCQPIAACPECRKTKKIEFSAARHREHGCEKYSARFKAELAERAELMAAGEYVLTSGLGVDEGVKASFRSCHGEKYVICMPTRNGRSTSLCLRGGETWIMQL